MLVVLLVFGAEVFVQVLVRNQSLPQCVREWLAVGLGIVDHYVNLEETHIEARLQTFSLLRIFARVRDTRFGQASS